MKTRLRIAVLVCLTTLFAGCASTKNQPAFYDFVDGAESNYEQRQAKQIRETGSADNRIKNDDIVAGGINVLFQGIIGLFSSKDKND
ncbi:hypothetical protein [Alteromonas facilis]|uniref:hypothetical protein n=1 Tax=Alteromonas facilis TaxID=2048004 RepID=UPI000C293671|nr:hypothetical protein [Alteromonas facilis]